MPRRLTHELAAVAVALALATAAVSPAAASSARPSSLSTEADRVLYARLCAQVDAAWDSTHGGWVAHGEPDADAIELALARGRDGDPLTAARARYTLAWMRGLLDTVGGGYVTSTRDLDPDKTFFDKRTIPNARRLELLVLAGRGATGPGAFDAARVADYFERVLVDPRGGFLVGQGGSHDLEPESNGVALQAWWRLGVASADIRRRAFARRTQSRLWAECREKEYGFVRRNDFGKIREPALLLDQIEMARAHLFAWRATGRDSELAFARELVFEVCSRFADGRGAFRVEYATDRLGHALRTRRPADDNARAARFLAEFASATGDTLHASFARSTWRALERPIEKAKLDAAGWALAVRALWAPDLPARSDWGERGGKPTAKAKAPASTRKPASKRR